MNPFPDYPKKATIEKLSLAAPMRLYHCSGDDQVPYANAVLAHQSYTNNGACCVELTNPETAGPLNHDQCWAPSMVDAKAWFDTMKK